MTQSMQLEKHRTITRRHLLKKGGLGLGAMALQALMANGTTAEDDASNQSDRLPGWRIPAKAKSVIYLHMAGSPSQLDLFEHKPALTKFHGQDCPKEYLEGKQFAFIKGTPKMLRGMFDYQQHGETGQWLSSLLPNLAKVIDDVCVIRTMHTDQFNHAPAQLLLHTGNNLLGAPAMGSWVNYGLGSENKNLPGFVVLASGGKTPSAGKSLWGSGFLPTLYQGVQCRTDGGDPILYLTDPKGMPRTARRKTLDAIRDLNNFQHQQIGDPEIVSRIAQYELAYRMQMSVPQVMDLKQESKATLDLYGARPGHVSAAETDADPRAGYRGDDATFANNCLLARRLVENGVRFVQLYDWGWDHHGSSLGESVDKTLPIKCQQIDQAIYGLLTDLKQRGLLDETLVVWGGEFGRTPMMQNNKNSKLVPGYIGRDHHPHAFTMWMAGAGIKPGVHGATDDIGYYIDQDPVGIRDLQATILHLLGLNPKTFRYAFHGLNQRLIGPSDEGQIIRKLLS